MKRKACPAARLLALEVEIDKAATRYAKTRAHRHLVELQRLQTAALRGGL